MKIFVRTPSGRMICLRVYPDETLFDVKQKLLEKHNFVFDGVRLEDNFTRLADYNIQHQSTIEMQEKMQIYVKEPLQGLTSTVDVNSSDTIDSIKDKMEKTDMFPKDRQCLIFAAEKLEGNRTLADYNICKDSTLLLVLHPCPGGTMQIYVRTLPGKILTLKVESSDTVDNIRVKIYEQKGIRPVHQRIVFSGKQLEGTRTLAYYKVQNESTLSLVERKCGC